MQSIWFYTFPNMNRIVLAIDVDEQHLRQANGHATEVVSLMVICISVYNN